MAIHSGQSSSIWMTHPVVSQPAPHTDVELRADVSSNMTWQYTDWLTPGDVASPDEIPRGTLPPRCGPCSYLQLLFGTRSFSQIKRALVATGLEVATGKVTGLRSAA